MWWLVRWLVRCLVRCLVRYARVLGLPNMQRQGLRNMTLPVHFGSAGVDQKFWTTGDRVQVNVNYLTCSAIDIIFG